MRSTSGRRLKRAKEFFEGLQSSHIFSETFAGENFGMCVISSLEVGKKIRTNSSKPGEKLKTPLSKLYPNVLYPL